MTGVKSDMSHLSKVDDVRLDAGEFGDTVAILVNS